MVEDKSGKFENLNVTQQALFGSGGSSDAQVHIWRNDNQEAKILLEKAGSIILKLAVSSENVATIGTIGNYPLQLQAAGTSGIYLSTNGLVGVGTTTPSFNLDVQGTINAVQFNKNGQRWKIINDDIDDNAAIDGNKMKDGSIPIKKIKDLPPSTSSQWVSGNSGIISYSGGNVGIGTNNPQFNLDVKGIINATQFFKNNVPWIISNSEIADNAITTAKIQDGSVGTAELANAAVNDTKIADKAVTTAKIADKSITQEKLAFQISPPGGSQWVSGSDGVISYSGGNVGIGTTQPGWELDIAGTDPSVRITAQQDKSSTVFLANSQGSWVINGPESSNNNSLSMYWKNQGQDGWQPYLSITNKGNVGIGTQNPQAPAHVVSSNKHTIVRIQSTIPGQFGAGRLEFWSDPQGSPSEWRAGYIQSTDQGNFTGGIGFFVNGTGEANKTKDVEVMRITNGNVGIRTKTPEALLHVSAPNDRFGGNVKFFPTSGKGLDFSYDGGSDSIFGFTHYGAETGELRFQWEGENNKLRGLLFITNKGEVRGNLVNTSSRDLKENITDFSTQEAIETLADLNPVKFNYREDKEKEVKVGFIAEDVPDLLATHERKGVSAVEIVAVLTKVIKEQQMELSLLRERVNALEVRD